MRKLKTTLVLLTLSSFTLFLKAQSPQPSNAAESKETSTNKYAATDWLSMMRDGSVNIHNVQKAFNKWYVAKNKSDKDKVKSTSEDNDGTYEFFKRWEWYNLPRADRNGNRPNAMKIATDYQNYLNTSQAHAPHHAGVNPPSTGAWTYGGNTSVPTGGGGAGRVNRVRALPGSLTTFFACCPSGGLWKTTNGGTSWSTVTDQLGDLSTSDIAINPTNTNVMYLATGDGDGIQGIYPTPATIGVLKSHDGGNTWEATGLTYTLSNAGANLYTVNEILIDPTDTSIVIAATSFGIYRSTNSGTTWTQEKAGWFHSIEFEPSHPSTVYAATSTLYAAGAQFFRSTNYGATWTQITSGLPASGYAEGYEIGVSAADTNYVYVLADSGSGSYGFEGLYRSTNHGVSFSTMSLWVWNGVPDVLGWNCGGSDNPDGGQGWYTLSMAVSPTNADSIWVGGVNMYNSADGGVTWHQTTDWTGGGCSGPAYVHADIHTITPIPGAAKQYLVGCDGGVFITKNSGSTWTDISSNLEISQQYCVGPSGVTSGKWITGWQDNGTNETGAPWKQIMGGDGMYCFIDRLNDNNMFAETGNGGVAYSGNGGTSWTNETVTGQSAPWVTFQVQDPKTEADIYAGFQDVFKSTNYGHNGSWTQISTWGASNGGEITAIAVDSANPNYIYASQSNKIELTTNGGTSWTNITGTLPIGSASIAGIAVKSKTPSHVWVCFQGYSSGNQVFESVNSGTTWTNISTGLPNLPVNCVASESGSANAIYVGTDQGVYYHDTVLNSWVFYNTGLPMVMIADLKISQKSHQLIAATYGRGTWASPLYTSLPPVAGFTASTTSVCLGNAVIFSDTSTNGPTSWNWTFAGGTPPTATTQTVSVVYSTLGGPYTVTLKATNGSGNNTVTRTNYITVNANPTASISSHTNVACKGENDGSATALGAGGASPYTYSWNGGATSTNATNSALTAGSYTVTVADKNGCTATASIAITQPATGVTTTASVTTKLACHGGDTAKVTASPSGGVAPYTYAWTGGGTNATKTGLSSGTYSVTVTDKNGCTASTTVTVTQPTALSSTKYEITSNVMVCNGIAAVTVGGGTAPYTYLWSPGAGTTDTIKNLCINSYCCTITDSKGCTDSMCVIINENATGVVNINNASNINIYPDPNNGSFTVAGVMQGQQIEVYNDLGQRLSSTLVDKATMYFDISNKTDGIYLIRILNKDGSLVTQKKIIKAQ